MQASECAQIGIIERLHAERDAIDAGAAVAAEAIGLDARRVGFQRDLGAGLHDPMGGDGVEDGTDCRDRKSVV